jgi:tetratricopeptide (TPR) repeat protein
MFSQELLSCRLVWEKILFCQDFSVSAKISMIACSGRVCYFFGLFTFKSKEGTVGTTKLTRKEITSEDPVHAKILQVIELFRSNGSKIGIAAAAIIVVVIGIYGGLQYLNRREMNAQDQLGKGMAFFHAAVAPDATDNPYSKGTTPIFRSDAAKYQAAAKEFSSIVSGYSYSAISVISRYYLGISQLQLGQKEEAIKNLESVASNSKNRTVGFLAKKVLAGHYHNSGNLKGAQEILEGLIRDPQCDLVKEDLSIQLSRVLISQGKRDGAIKVLREANSQNAAFGAYKQQLVAELDKLQNAPGTGAETKGVHP